MRRMTLLWVLCTLMGPGCFDDAVTIGLECESDLECGEGQACGPGVLEDNGSPTPDQVCGVAQDEGWEPCQDTDPTLCGGDFETALVCRNGFRTETDCDVVCEAEDEGQREDGVCGALVPESNADCACAYAVNELPDGAAGCYQSDDGLELVRSTSFGSDDVAAYLQTCDEWCALQSEIPSYQGSLCAETFLETAAGAIGGQFASALANRGGRPCVCRLTEPPECPQGQPKTQCSGQNLVELCTDTVRAQIQCLDGCGPLVPGMPDTDWCL